MGTACNLTYLGPFGPLQVGGRLWEVGVACQLPRSIAEKLIRTYHLAEWKLEEVESEEELEAEAEEVEVVEETESEPEPAKPKRRTKRFEPDASGEEPTGDELIKEEE